MKIRRQLRTSAVGAGLIFGFALLPGQAANAATTTYLDPSGDTGARSDIRRVQVDNSRATDLFRVRVRVDRVILGTDVSVYVDLNRKNRGPELRMSAAPDSEWALSRVKGWKDRGKRIALCGKVRFSTDFKPVVVWRTTRTCVNLQGKARVAVKLRDKGHGTDWAPAPRRFYPGVTPRY